MYDLTIIGAGPAGISAAYAAKKQGLNYLVLERDKLASTIENYPLGKPLFSTADELEFEPGTLHPIDIKPTREELIDYYHRFIEQERLNIHTNEAVETVTAGKIFTITTSNSSYSSSNIIMAMGGMGIFNRLGVEGETEDRVSYIFRDASPYRGKNVLVVGGGNSAAEVSLYLYDAGANVTLAIRRPSFDPLEISKGSAIKPWVREPLERAIDSGKAGKRRDDGTVRACFSTKIMEIRPQTVILDVDGSIEEIACDHIFALIGSRPDTSLLSKIGVKILEDGRPEYNPETFETSIPNLFVAGHITRAMHMKRAISVPPHIVTLIASRIRKVNN